MTKSKILIISPSGNFYGSEQVLFDYLGHTNICADVVTPANSYLYKRLKKDVPQHTIKAFQSNRLLQYYFRLLANLFLNRYNRIYLNEAGHVKYILLLSKIFPRKKFVVHVRIVEDASKDRWILKPGKNVTVLAISNYLSAQLSYPSIVLYDPFPFSHELKGNDKAEKKHITIGIIGRITLTKGLNRLLDLLALIKQMGKENMFQFRLFGSISPDAEQDGLDKRLTAFENVAICGFEASRERLYSAIDCVMHLSTQEALGRIYLEAIDNGKPFIGLKAAGIGEIASLLQMEDRMADPTAQDLPYRLLDLLEHTLLNYNVHLQKMALYKPVAEKIFNISSYTASIDKLLVS